MTGRFCDRSFVFVCDTAPPGLYHTFPGKPQGVILSAVFFGASMPRTSGPEGSSIVLACFRLFALVLRRTSSTSADPRAVFSEFPARERVADRETESPRLCYLDLPPRTPRRIACISTRRLRQGLFPVRIHMRGTASSRRLLEIPFFMSACTQIRPAVPSSVPGFLFISGLPFSTARMALGIHGSNPMYPPYPVPGGLRHYISL